MLDMELSSSITARFSTRPCDFCRTNLEAAAVSVRGQMGEDHQNCHAGTRSRPSGPEEFLVAESPPAYDAIVTAKVLSG